LLSPHVCLLFAKGNLLYVKKMFLNIDAAVRFSSVSSPHLLWLQAHDGLFEEITIVAPYP